jgi:hypothetical protein
MGGHGTILARKQLFAKSSLLMRAFLTLLAASLVSLSGASASCGLPTLPARWPHTLQLGVADEAGGAAALRKVAPFGFRYHYLAGGVNTGQGVVDLKRERLLRDALRAGVAGGRDDPGLLVLHAAAVEGCGSRRAPPRPRPPA